MTTKPATETKVHRPVANSSLISLFIQGSSGGAVLVLNAYPFHDWISDRFQRILFTTPKHKVQHCACFRRSGSSLYFHSLCNCCTLFHKSACVLCPYLVYNCCRCVFATTLPRSRRNRHYFSRFVCGQASLGAKVEKSYLHIEAFENFEHSGLVELRALELHKQVRNLFSAFLVQGCW
jgi:hypothetical protein